VGIDGCPRVEGYMVGIEVHRFVVFSAVAEVVIVVSAR
jgi:hypothetical protein